MQITLISRKCDVVFIAQVSFQGNPRLTSEFPRSRDLVIASGVVSEPPQLADGVPSDPSLRAGSVPRVQHEITSAPPTQLDRRAAQRSLDQLLLVRALADDRAALAALVSRLTPIIQARVARVLRRRASAGQLRCAVADLTQEVFVRLLASDRRALRAWDPARGLSLSSFVGLIAEREASSVLDSQRRTPRSDQLELHGDLEELSHGWGEPTGERQQIARDLVAKLCERLRAWLSPRGRELFELVYVQQEPLASVAKRFGMPPSAVYAWRNRVGKRARELLNELA